MSSMVCGKRITTWKLQVIILICSGKVSLTSLQLNYWTTLPQQRFLLPLGRIVRYLLKDNSRRQNKRSLNEERYKPELRSITQSASTITILVSKIFFIYDYSWTRKFNVHTSWYMSISLTSKKKREGKKWTKR